MPIQNIEEFDKVLNVSWYSPEKPREEHKLALIALSNECVGSKLTKSSFPCVLPFSQMYPLCCIDIRNFLNQFYFFSNDDFSNPDVIDETLKNVCQLLYEIYLGIYVSNLISGTRPAAFE
jgi:exocyst complex component 6